MPSPRWPTDGPLSGAMPEPSDPDESSLELDLLRAELYRLLDHLARSGPDLHRDLVLEFERGWEAFKRATARGA